MTIRSVLVLFAAVLFSLPGAVFADENKPSENSDLTAADRLAQSGAFADAILMYQHALKTDPKLVPAQAGLVRAYLRDNQVDAAFELAKTSLAAQPNSAPLLAAMGAVQYRRGEIPDAETSLLSAKKIDPDMVQSYLVLARLYRTALLFRRAYDQVKRAHEIAPQDPEVQRAWLGMLPRRDRLKALEAYLASPHPDNTDENASLIAWLEYLKATVDQPVHSCKLTNNIENTETQMQILLRDTKHVAGYGLLVKINDRNQRLLLDTGASGILINRRAAEKAGLKRISEVQFKGIGDKGQRDAYFAVADQVRIGDLEFKDCVVTVSEKSMGLDEDGLIGADVFSSYVVDIDIPADMLRLSPLPKRPEDSAAKASLASEADSNPDPDDQAESAKAPSPQEKPGPDKSPAPAASPRLPKDRYIAPEMAKWARIYRIGHDLLVPTHVNESKTMLFILDTGAFSNMMSTKAARTVTKVSSDETMKIKGLSGEVNKTYSADKATLQFGNIRQPNQDIVSIDLSGLSKSLGVEVSGFLGFSTFRQLEMKIDYRDGLVEFIYDPSKLPPALRP
jgi:predicted aspartyl protease/Tfp pilus assembly protein PilF